MTDHEAEYRSKVAGKPIPEPPDPNQVEMFEEES